MSAADLADVPPAVVTVTSTLPVPAGDVTVNVVALTNVTLVPGVAPNWTVATTLNPVPVTVTAVPPLAGPPEGLMPLTVGAATEYVNLSSAAVVEVPPR